MKPVTGSEEQAVLDAVAAGEAIPPGYGFDGTTVYKMDAEDEQRIADGGPVMDPEYEAPPTEGLGPSPPTTTKAATNG